MDLARISVHRPIFTTCLVLVMLLLGFMSMRKIPVDLYPDVTIPTVVIYVNYNGAGPAEIESLITKVVEEEISGLSGLKKLNSTSREGVSEIVAEFTQSTDIKYAEQQIRDKLAVAKRKLPEDIDEPTVRTIDPADQPVSIVALSSSELSKSDLYDLAEKEIKPYLEQINRVGLVAITGGQKREVQVQLDLNKLKHFEVSATDVSRALGDSGENIPSGKTTGATQEVSYRTLGEFEDLKQIENTIVRFIGNEHPLTIRQLGQVVDSVTDETSRSYLNGDTALLMMIFRQSGANTIQVADDVTARVAQINEKYNDSDFKLKAEVVHDGAKPIRDNVADVNEAILIGVILTFVVVYFFLGNIRATFITGLAIPNALIGTFIFMALAGFSINIMSLLALSLAVGLLIDDAIVVRENIFRHIESGKTAMQAALDGTREVTMAVIATTASVIAVFGPIGFIDGVIGQFFKEFALTICFGMVISTLDALMVAPMLSAYFAGSFENKAPRTILGKLNRLLIDGFDKFQTFWENQYEKLLHFTLRWRKSMIFATVVLCFGSFYLINWIPKTFIPPLDNGEFMVSLRLPGGSSLDYTANVAREIDDKISSHPEVQRTLVMVGNRGTEPNSADIRITLHKMGEARSMTTEDFRNITRKILEDYEFAEPKVLNSQQGGGGGGRQFNMNLQGPDLVALEELSQKFLDAMAASETFNDPESSFIKGKPELQFVVSPEIAREAGLSTRVIGNELRNLVAGTTPAVFRENDTEYDIRVRLRESQRDLQNSWHSVLVPNINNTFVPLGLVTEAKLTTSSDNIKRVDRSRTVVVSADINPKGPGFAAALEEVKELFAKFEPPSGFSYSFSGDAEQMQDLMKNMMMAAGLGTLFIFFVLASLYESFITPFAIMTVLPLAIMGAFWGLFVMQSTLDLYSLIGCVMLLGLATKNSILLVDYINQMMDQGIERSVAIVQACKTRLRPILMTSFSLVAGMIPIAIGLNEASQQRTSLGVAVIGGTISSTLLTLVIVPATFIYIDSFKNFINRHFNYFVRGIREESVLVQESPAATHPVSIKGQLNLDIDFKEEERVSTEQI